MALERKQCWFKNFLQRPRLPAIYIYDSPWQYADWGEARNATLGDLFRLTKRAMPCICAKRVAACASLNFVLCRFNSHLQTLGGDRAGVDRVDAHAIFHAAIANTFVKFINAALTDPPMANSALPVRPPMPMMLMIDP